MNTNNKLIEYVQYSINSGAKTIGVPMSLLYAAPIWEKVTCPVLLIFGETDNLVKVRVEEPVIVGALERGGNPAHSRHVIPGAGHNFRTNEGGHSGFSESAVEAIVIWLNEVGDAEPSR